MTLELKHVSIAAVACLGLAAAARAGDYSNAASYNSPYGLAAGAENQPVNPSLRDANGNLTVVDGRFTSSAFASATGVQSMGTAPFGAAGASYGGATAIGNALNVVTVGSNNTVVVNSSQTNNGTQTASVHLNGD